MRLFRLHGMGFVFAVALALGFVVATQSPSAYCQETTGGLQGTVKDPAGAVVAKATVTVTGTTMIGSKVLVTDSSGYYRFANLPPGVYTIVVKAEGFETFKREGVNIDAGRLPSVDIPLKVGSASTTVEVSGAAPVIDTTTTQNVTNITSESLQSLPTGISYQSVIQFAPMARNEPLDGLSQNGRGTGGTGGSMPGSSGNGNNFGYSIGGAADSESSYLVEGQDTENISGGYSKANVPMDFIDEVQMKTSGVEAQYGGALGGVINVIMKKGGNQFHGSLFTTYESSGTDANSTNAFVRYNPEDPGDAAIGLDPVFQTYQASKDHIRILQPGFLVGGPIVKDRFWFVMGFNPLYNSRAKTVNFGSNDDGAGNQYFTSDHQTYYTYGRLDAALSQKIRVFGSWLYQYARVAGTSMPVSDPIVQESSFLNPSINSPLGQFSHGLGSAAPNATFNFGADITITPKLVSTTRYGYFFDNYHDFGWPTSVANLEWFNSGVGETDNAGNPLPTDLQKVAGATTQPYDSTYTLLNADKHYQFNQDFAFFKGGWWGTHNFKFGYQLNHLANVINQNGNVPFVWMHPGSSQSYSPATTTGVGNCDLLAEEWGQCAGQYGFVSVQDFATILLNSSQQPTPASDWNHAFYVQDSWNVGHGLTFDLGLRLEKETLPAPAGVNVSTIAFGWGDKIAPRLGAAWDPTGKGKMKFFGSYGVVNDVMKLLLAQTSWGAQAYEDCNYPLGPDGEGTYTDTADDSLNLVFVKNRACPSAPPTTGANFSPGIPTVLTDAGSGVSLIENVNWRPWEPVAPGVKPYRQHEFVVGWDYQINPHLAFEARYDRRRLDHIIEDASLWDTSWGETYTIVNPGEGVNSTIDGYAAYLASLGAAFGVAGPPPWEFNATAFGTCPSCPPMPKAIRNYDGVELRLSIAPYHGMSGVVSYTYSSLWGNYTGLTTTDQTDGGITGRDSPDTTRAFDEPFFYFGANGQSNAGPLPTDRPNVFKGQIYYAAPSWKHNQATLGIFQQMLQGSPVSSYIGVGYGSYNGEPLESTYVYGRGQWVDLTRDASTGLVTASAPYARRTPWFTQTDFSLADEIKTGEHESIKFEGTAQNLWNQRAVTSYWASMDSTNFSTGIFPGGEPVWGGAPFYQAAESGYNVQSLLTADGVIQNSQYGQPYLYQNGRTVRFAVHYTF